MHYGMVLNVTFEQPYIYYAHKSRILYVKN